MKDTGKSSIISVITALLLAAIIAAGVMVIGYVSRDDSGKWFGNSDLASWSWNKDGESNADTGNNDPDNTGNKDPDNPTAAGSGGAVISKDGDNDNFSILSAKLPRSAYAANGIAENADTAYTLTATIIPEYAYNKTLEWAIAWENSSSSWARGKVVTDYVTIEPVEDLAANVTCLQAFGEPVRITCCIKDSNIKSTCQADYVKNVSDINIVSGLTKQDDGSYLWVWNNYERDETVLLESFVPSLIFDTVYGGVGTKDADISTQSVTLEFGIGFDHGFGGGTGVNLEASTLYNSLTVNSADLLKPDGSGFLNQLYCIYHDGDHFAIDSSFYKWILTGFSEENPDIIVTVTAGNFTKTFNVNVVVSAESVDLPPNIEF